MLVGALDPAFDVDFDSKLVRNFRKGGENNITFSF